MATTSVWAAPPGILVQNQGALSISLGFLTLSVGVLGFLEIHDALKRKNLSKSPNFATESTEVGPEIAGEQAGSWTSPASTVMAAAPPPPSAPMSPSLPPPVGPLPVAPAATSQSLPKVPTPPASEGGDQGSGGWGDLLKRVRSSESGDLTPTPKVSSNSSSTVTISVPAHEPRLPAGGLEVDEGWDALLKKSSGQVGSPFPSQPGGLGVDPEPGRAGSGGNEEGGLPDFIKKSSRTISLDFTKGGAASNPFQKPPS